MVIVIVTVTVMVMITTIVIMVDEVERPRQKKDENGKEKRKTVGGKIKKQRVLGHSSVPYGGHTVLYISPAIKLHYDRVSDSLYRPVLTGGRINGRTCECRTRPRLFQDY